MSLLLQNDWVNINPGSTAAGDSSTIAAKDLLKALSTTTNDGGASILGDFVEKAVNEYQYTTKSGSPVIRTGEMVRIAIGYGAGTASVL